MLYIESPSVDPKWNLALEEYVFSHMDPTESYFMLWQNHNTVVIGKNQNTVAEINTDYVQAHDIQVVRRLSGGGAVYHDLGNLNFSFIADAEALNEINFKKFCLPVVKTLQEMGVPAEVNGRNDMVIAGRKFSGNAQYTKNGRVLHHGTLMFCSDLNVVAAALNPNKEKLQTKGIASVSSRVCNISEFLPETVSLAQFRQNLIRNILGEDSPAPYSFTQDDLAQIEKLKAARYDQWNWNYGFSPRYQIVKERRIEGCGTLQLSMDVEKGILKDIEFFGDFFDYGNLEELKQILKGCSICRDALDSILSAHSPDKYIRNLSAQQLADLIAEG